MVEKRLVECQDCGYRWESTAESPRCAKAECGRSRHVEPVHDRDETTDEDDEDARPAPSAEMDAEPAEPIEDDEDDEQDDEQADEGYTPAFTSSSVRKDSEPEEPEPIEADEDGDREQSRSRSRSEPDRDEADDRDEQEPEPAEAEPRPAEIELDPETLEPAIDTTFQIAANRRGPHWELEDDEAGLLADSWCPVLNHYAPAMMREHTIVGVALLATYSVVGPKLSEDRKLREIEEADREDTEPTNSLREPVIEDADEEPAERIEETPSDPERNGAVGGYANV